MANPAKMVTDRRKSSLTVENSVGTSGETVAAKLAARSQALAAVGGPEPDYLLLLQTLGGQLAQAREKLTAADQRHRDEVSADVEQRVERDGAVKELNQQILKLRDSFTGLYGVTACKTLGFDDRTARDPMPLLAQGQRLNDNLQKTDLLPAPQTPGIAVDLTTLRPPLESAVDRLRKAIVNLTRERTKADLTLVAKKEAMTAFDATFLWVARALEALYSLAGEYDLAARVRPSRRRPGRTESADPQTGTDPADPTQEPGPQKPPTAPAPELPLT